MATRYVAVDKVYGTVLSSPSELRDPETQRLACALWCWVPDPDGKRGHHFDSRADAKAIVRAIGTDLSKVTFRKAA